MKKGDTVRIIQPLIQGEIKKVDWDENEDKKRFLVDFSGSEGKVGEKWVHEDKLELM